MLDNQEDERENLSPELTVEEIIQQEPVIPTIPEQFQVFSKNNERLRCEVCFVSEDLFDAEKISKLQRRDYKHYLRYKKFNKIHHFNYNQEPFSYMYEKKCWELTAMTKFNYLLRNKVNPLNSEPFSPSGKCAYFEFETLYSPQKCQAYHMLSYKLVKKNLEKFTKASIAFNVDTYDDTFAMPIPDGLEAFDVVDYKATGKEPRLIDDDEKPDEVPTSAINRNEWPSKFLSLEDKPVVLEQEGGAV